jgi:spermidine synthase
MKRVSQPEVPVPEVRRPAGRNRSVLFLAVCALGVSAFMTQLTLMRELLSVFAGNELVLGIVLGNWLLLTGLGSYLGKTAARLRDGIAVLVAAQVLVGVLPIAQVFLLRTLRHVVFLRGADVGVTETVLACFLLLAPYCLIAGYLLTLASLLLASRNEPSSIGQVYFLDNIGDVVGGLLFSFVLVYFFNHFQILYVPALLNLLMAAAVALVHHRWRWLAIAAAAGAAGTSTVLWCDLDRISTRALFPGQEVVFKDNSPYGSLVVTRSAGQYTFVENGVVLFSTGNVEQVEETVHYAMAQRPHARRVLLVSGGVCGTAKEILRYEVQAVDYVELDPLIIRVARLYLPDALADPRIHVVNTDGRLFVRQSPHRYDVVIVDVPDPLNSQINRFYTREFFGQVAGRLTADGVLCISLGHYENYLSDELADLIAVTHRTLSGQFENVLVLPAGKIYYLASDGPLTTDVAGRIERQGIETQLVGRHYLDGILTPDRLAAVRRAITPEAPVNGDFNPILYYYDLRYWMSQFKWRFGFMEAVFLLMLIVGLLRARPVSFAIFTTGLAASALEVVLLVGFQVLYGCVYHQVGLIVTMFMIGLGIGSFTMNRLLPQRSRKDLVWLEAAVAVYAVGLPFVLMTLGRLEAVTLQLAASQLVVPLLALGLAVLVGLEFPLAGKADFRTVSDTAARLYTADYLGAALGALLVSTLLIPVMGVVAVCVLAGALNLVSGAVVFWTSRT